jgi:hypothetical protein
MRIIIAARLSQIFGQTGIDTQDILSREYAKLHGHEVVAVIADRKSGTVPPWKRPNLRAWVEDPEKLALYDGVLGSVFDRLSRGDNKTSNEIEQWAWTNHKQLLTADGLFFPCEAEDGIRWDLAKRLAHAEWLRTSRRYRTMHAHLRSNNWLVGRRPYVTQIVGVECGESPCVCKNDRKVLELNPERADVGLMMVNWIMDGKSRQSLAEELNKRGVPTSSTGTEWTPKIVNEMLRSENLIGRRKDASGKVILRFDPLLTMEQWHKLQAQLDATVRRRGPVRVQPAMLSGVAYCAKCKGIMHYRQSGATRLDGSKYTWGGYRCDGKPAHPSTCKVMVTASNLDGWVNMQMMGEPIGSQKIIETTWIPGHNYEEEIEQVEQDLRDLDFDDPEYDEKHAALRLEHKRLRDLPSVPASSQERKTGQTVAQRWVTLDTQGRRDYLLRAKAKVYVGGKQVTDDWSLEVARPNVLAALPVRDSDNAGTSGSLWPTHWKVLQTPTKGLRHIIDTSTGHEWIDTVRTVGGAVKFHATEP